MINNTNMGNQQREEAKRRVNRNNRRRKYKFFGKIAGCSLISGAIVIVIGYATAKKNNEHLKNDLDLPTSSTNSSIENPENNNKVDDKDNTNSVDNNDNTSDVGNNDNTSNSNIKENEETSKPNNIDSLGVELENPKKDTPKNEYSNPTGNIKVDNIVEDNTGKLWANSEAASKKDEIGKVTIDDNNGKYEVKPDGDVYQKEPEYQIVDNNGSIISEGTSDIIDDYVWDPVYGGYVHKDEVGKYVIGSDGKKWEKEKYEKYLESLKNDNTSSTVETEFIPMDPIEIETEFIPIDDALISSGTIVGSNIKEDNTTSVDSDEELTLDDGKIMPDGTYAIWDLVFESKEDFEQWFINDGEGYKRVNGVMVPIETQESTYTLTR